MRAEPEIAAMLAALESAGLQYSATATNTDAVTVLRWVADGSLDNRGLLDFARRPDAETEPDVEDVLATISEWDTDILAYDRADDAVRDWPDSEIAGLAAGARAILRLCAAIRKTRSQTVNAG